jgi:hypothetical protein
MARARYIIPGVVAKVERRSRTTKAWKDRAGEIQSEREDLGWFMMLEGWGTGIGLGTDNPLLGSGQRVRIIIEPE